MTNPPRPPSPRLSPVSDADLPVYPIDRAERLDSHSFTKWQHQRWLSSSMFRRASWETQGMARALFDMAQSECPVGTLPAHDAELAMMLRVSETRVRELRFAEFGPFHNWVSCISEGEVRLMHPVVLEQVRDALERRDVRVQSNDKKAVAMRVKRLRAAWTVLGVVRDTLADDVLIERVDEWMTVQGMRNRRERDYRAALLHAQAQRWLGRIEGGV